MNLAARISALEAQLPKPELLPSDYEAYLYLSKSLSNANMSGSGPLFLPNGEINMGRYDSVQVPEHCIAREEYEALTWSSAEQCTKWILDRCGMYRSNSVCLFMCERVSSYGDTMTVEQQREALAITFEGFDLSDIEPQPDMLKTDFIVHVIETVNVWRKLSGGGTSLIPMWGWTCSATHEQAELFRKNRLANHA